MGDLPYDPEAPAEEAPKKRKSKWGAGTAAGSFDTSVKTNVGIAPTWKPPDPNAPKAPPPMPVKKKITWENDDHFILDMKLNYDAESAFRQLDSVYRQKVMDLGPLLDTDPSSACIARIKYIQEKEVNEKAVAFREEQSRVARAAIEKIGPAVRQTPETGGSYEDFESADAIFRDQVEKFCQDNCLDSGAKAKLIQAGVEVQQKVMSFGNFVGTNDPSSACLQRIKNAELAIQGEEGMKYYEGQSVANMLQQNFGAIENKYTPY